MKSVMLSIRPKWYEKIVSGEKTIEVRKSAPKEVPFKCYIYMTQGKYKDLGLYSEDIYQNRMKVIGEFICDRIYEWTYNCNVGEYNIGEDSLRRTCLSYSEFENYGKGKTLYGWHITDLKIYDKPKELSEFCIPCKVSCENCKNPLYFECRCEEKGKKIVTRPPQSYMFVEEVEQ